jgi:hypothetical protein
MADYDLMNLPWIRKLIPFLLRRLVQAIERERGGSQLSAFISAFSTSDAPAALSVELETLCGWRGDFYGRVPRRRGEVADNLARSPERNAKTARAGKRKINNLRPSE